jgi:hypothetical protein
MLTSTLCVFLPLCRHLVPPFYRSGRCTRRLARQGHVQSPDLYPYSVLHRAWVRQEPGVARCGGTGRVCERGAFDPVLHSPRYYGCVGRGADAHSWWLRRDHHGHKLRPAAFHRSVLRARARPHAVQGDELHPARHGHCASVPEVRSGVGPRLLLTLYVHLIEASYALYPSARSAPGVGGVLQWSISAANNFGALYPAVTSGPSASYVSSYMPPAVLKVTPSVTTLNTRGGVSCCPAP